MRICRKITWGFTLIVVMAVTTAIFSMQTFWHIDQQRLELRAEALPNVQQTMRLYTALVKMDHWIATYLLDSDAVVVVEKGGADIFDEGLDQR